LTTYFHVNGRCGSAKTYAAIRYAHRIARLGKKVLIVQPSIFLITETMRDLSGLTPDVRCRAIHGENSDKVIADIIEHLKHTGSGGEILFITHSALMLLPYFHRKQDWHVIVDEVPQADWCTERWPGKFGQVDKWKICLRAAKMPRNRRYHDETRTPDPYTGFQG